MGDMETTVKPVCSAQPWSSRVVIMLSLQPQYGGVHGWPAACKRGQVEDGTVCDGRRLRRPKGAKPYRARAA
jgi:hypothetical protein